MKVAEYEKKRMNASKYVEMKNKEIPVVNHVNLVLLEVVKDSL